MVREFFVDDIQGIPFKLFGIIHFLCILITIIGMFLVYINRNKILELPYNIKKRIKLLIVLIMFINMKLYYIPLIIYGRYDWHNHLPLHFCFISGYLFMYALLSNKTKLYKIIYFFTYMGPIPAILWPDPAVKSSFDSFLFYQFFISHHFFLVANLFVFYSQNISFKLKDTIKSFVVANFIFLTMAIFNMIFKTNYIMSKELPPHIIELFPFLEKVTHPFIILEFTAIIIILIAYIPIYLRNKEKKENSSLQHMESLL